MFIIHWGNWNMMSLFLTDKQHLWKKAFSLSHKLIQPLLLLWRILNGRGLPSCLTELPSLKCLSSSYELKKSCRYHIYLHYIKIKQFIYIAQHIKSYALSIFQKWLYENIFRADGHKRIKLEAIEGPKIGGAR